nr:MAG TPA: hypothetical protein [Crassvirales sp.]
MNTLLYKRLINVSSSLVSLVFPVQVSSVTSILNIS